MLNVVSDRLIAEKVPVIERVEALRLIHDGKRCYGAIVRDLITGELMAYVAKATAIATGGAGRIYRVTTNAVICDGVGYDLALTTGVASLSNMDKQRDVEPEVFAVLGLDALAHGNAFFHAAGNHVAGGISFVKFTKSATTSSALIRRRNGFRFVRPSTTRWAASARTRPANLRSSKVSSLPMAMLSSMRRETTSREASSFFSGSTSGMKR